MAQYGCWRCLQHHHDKGSPPFALDPNSPPGLAQARRSRVSDFVTPPSEAASRSWTRVTDGVVRLGAGKGISERPMARVLSWSVWLCPPQRLVTESVPEVWLGVTTEN